MVNPFAESDSSSDSDEDDGGFVVREGCLNRWCSDTAYADNLRGDFVKSWWHVKKDTVTIYKSEQKDYIVSTIQLTKNSKATVVEKIPREVQKVSCPPLLTLIILSMPRAAP